MSPVLKPVSVAISGTRKPMLSLLLLYGLRLDMFKHKLRLALERSGLKQVNWLQISQPVSMFTSLCILKLCSKIN